MLCREQCEELTPSCTEITSNEVCWARRVAYEAPEESFYGMPGLDFFGAHFASKHLVALAGVTVFFSWYASICSTG